MQETECRKLDKYSVFSDAPLMKNSNAARILVSLYDLARADRSASLGLLAEMLGVSATVAAEALLELDRRGLADADRCRLSFSGLAIASTLLTRLEPQETPAASADAPSTLAVSEAA